MKLKMPFFLMWINHGAFPLLILLSLPLSAATFPEIVIKDSQDSILELVPERLNSIRYTPIKRTRERLNMARHDDNFFSIYQLQLTPFKDGDTYQFTMRIGETPLRVTFISIYKESSESPRKLHFQESVLLSEYSELVANVAFKPQLENLSFIIAEQIASEDDDISYGVEAMEIIRTHDLIPVVKDCGTNWRMNQVNFKIEVIEDNKKVINIDLSLDKFINMFSNIKWIIAIVAS